MNNHLIAIALLVEIESLREETERLRAEAKKQIVPEEWNGLVDENVELRNQRNALANALWSAEDQWGEDYLWAKWELSKHLTDELKDELKKEIVQ